MVMLKKQRDESVDMTPPDVEVDPALAGDGSEVKFLAVNVRNVVRKSELLHLYDVISLPQSGHSAVFTSQQFDELGSPAAAPPLQPPPNAQATPQSAAKKDSSEDTPRRSQRLANQTARAQKSALEPDMYGEEDWQEPAVSLEPGHHEGQAQQQVPVEGAPSEVSCMELFCGYR